MSKELTLARDLLTRAGHTAYQAGAATFALLWAQSGLHLSDLAHAGGWARLWSSVIVGVLAAVVSALKTATVGYLAARRGRLLADAEHAIEAESPKLAADIAARDTKAAIADVKAAAGDAEQDAVADLQPSTVDGEHPAAADPDNRA